MSVFSVNTLFIVARVAFKGMAFFKLFDLKSYWRSGRIIDFDHFCHYICVSKPLKHKDNHVIFSFVPYCILAFLMILSLSLLYIAWLSCR